MNTNRLLIFFGIVLIIGYFVYSGGYLNGVVGSGNKVICDVVIRNPITSDLFEVKSSSCRIVGECGLFQISPLSVGENIANVRLVVSGKTIASEQIEIEDFLGGTGNVQLTGCAGEESSGVIQVRNNVGILTDSQMVGF